MRTRRFDFNWKPLQLQISFAVEGSVPDKQNYNADTQEYTPDYVITPLIIQPNISIIDKGEMLQAGRINNKLTNIRWKENIGGVSTVIAASNPGYEILTTGANAGRIKLKKNVQPANPITLEFYADYLDSRNNQIIVIQGTYLINCSNASDLVRVELNAADQTIFNPLSDAPTQSVTATVYVGQNVCAAPKYQLVWELMGEDNTWHTVGTDEILDYAITISGNTATINKWLMGSEMQLRCRVKYSPTGTPSSVALDDSTPQALISFVRHIPAFEYDITGVPYDIPAGLLQIAPEAVIRTTVGIINNPELELLPLWYMATNVASGSLSYVLRGHGINPTMSTDLMSGTHGAVIGLDVVDRGYAGAFMDNTDGRIFTDNTDGKVIIIH